MQQVVADSGTAPERSTREDLIAAATQLFRTRGFEGTSIEAIGATAGVRGPAMYYHFASKSALLHECLAGPLRELLSLGQEAVRDRSAVEQVRAFTAAHVRFQLTHFAWPQAHRGALVATGALISALPAKEQKQLFRLERRHLDTLRSALTDGAASGDLLAVPVTPTAFAIIGMADQVITWYQPDHPLTPDDVADFYAELAVRMVAAPRPRRRRT
ncbi:MAG: hypothetical protein QOE05_2993 [Actinomycetota bacterium]|jgi:AcrR family transcriptional regulator|nr:hypothetical protein [Actinomycetota bacterium]